MYLPLQREEKGAKGWKIGKVELRELAQNLIRALHLNEKFFESSFRACFLPSSPALPPTQMSNSALRTSSIDEGRREGVLKLSINLGILTEHNSTLTPLTNHDIRRVKRGKLLGGERADISWLTILPQLTSSRYVSILL